VIQFFGGTFFDNRKEKQNRKILYFLFFCVRLADSVGTLKSYNSYTALVETCTYRNPFEKLLALKIIRARNKKNFFEINLFFFGNCKK
jgi:hypothetical protein